MELYIESLTGTCFELIVSPYETILSVKTKIQRLEGIPISQQYLIWQETHLDDDYCLKDYGITGGCTLKLVLAMRGGPINTRRVAIEDDASMQEMANYFESEHADFFDKLSPPPSRPGKSKQQITLLVYRDGDNLNFYRVVDRGDGTLTPFSESLSDSTFNPRDEDEDDEETAAAADNDNEYQMIRRNIVGAAASNHHTSLPSSSSQKGMSLSKIFENNVTASKMKQVRNRMRNFSINDKMPAPPTMEKPDKPAATRRKIKGSSGNLPTYDAANQKTFSSSSMFQLNDSIPATAKSDAKISSQLEQSNSTEHKHDCGENTETLKPAAQNHSEHSINSTKSSPGLLFNNHDLYLRTYGLVQNKDNVDDSQPSISNSQEKIRLLPPVIPPTAHKFVSGNEDTASHKIANNLRNSRPADLLKNINHPPSSPPVVVKKSDTPTTNHLLSHYQKINKSKSKSRESFTSTSTTTPRNHLLPSLQHHLKPLDTAKLLSSDEDDKTLLNSDDDFLRSYFSPSNFLMRAESSSSMKNAAADHHHHLNELKRNLAAGKSSPPTTSNNGSSTNLFTNKHPLSSYLRNQSPFNRNLTISPKLNPVPKIPNTSKSKDSSNKLKAAAIESRTREVEAARHQQDTREFIDFLTKTVDSKMLRHLVCSPVKDNDQTVTNAAADSDVYKRRPEKLKSRSGSRRALLKRVTSGGKQRLSPVLPPTKSSQHKMLPPVKAPGKKKRCFLCGKRTGLATSYICRCGYNFCSTHRYAEAHSCTYDYKTAGRKVLEATNPLVRAPKLPKI